MYVEDALRAAHAADEAIAAGYRLGPLHGVPVAVKDIVDWCALALPNGFTPILHEEAMKSFARGSKAADFIQAYSRRFGRG